MSSICKDCGGVDFRIKDTDDISEYSVVDYSRDMRICFCYTETLEE